ncbi:hypothetical protein CRENBAI_024546 [Crenichthys baileyi]|uniref:AH domain-containing protein n=1 Tax=Crenichthys baileyi TaxID=28760 RepID=A0AAV9R8V6_9TELE
MMEASEEIKDSEASDATEEEVTPPEVRCHEDVCSKEKPECELSETEKKKMMEASEEKGDVSAASNTTEEEENPPKETNSNCNHGDEDSPDCSTEAAAAQVSVETDQSREVTVTPQKPDGGPVVVEASNKNPATEKLERVRKWSISKYKCTRQALSEKLGRGSRTVDLDLEPRLELLKDDRQRYDHMAKLAQRLANQFAQFSFIQKTLGDTFNELSVKSKDLHVEFGMNAEAQRFLSKSTGILESAINSFTFDMNTLVNKTIEDTMINAKQYEAARIEYDAYRVDLEELNMGPRDTNTVPKLEQAQKTFQGQREKYEKVRDDLAVKVKLVEENRVKVLHNQLWLLHSAVAAHCISCHSFLEKNMQQAVEHLNMSSVDAPSWLEES